MIYGHDIGVVNNKREPQIIFGGGDETTLMATVGCNRILADFTQNGATLSIGPARATKMACIGDVARAENDLLDLLKRVSSFQIIGDNLVLIASDGNVLAELSAVYL